MKIEKFKVFALPEEDRTRQVGQSSHHGKNYSKPDNAQFGTKLSCTPKLWNARESRLDGKSREAVETNAKIEKLLLAVNTAFEELQGRKRDFDAKAVKELLL